MRRGLWSPPNCSAPPRALQCRGTKVPFTVASPSGRIGLEGTRIVACSERTDDVVLRVLVYVVDDEHEAGRKG
jgi:hypothetical protein